MVSGVRLGAFWNRVGGDVGGKKSSYNFSIILFLTFLSFALAGRRSRENIMRKNGEWTGDGKSESDNKEALTKIGHLHLRCRIRRLASRETGDMQIFSEEVLWSMALFSQARGSFKESLNTVGFQGNSKRRDRYVQYLNKNFKPMSSSIGRLQLSWKLWKLIELSWEWSLKQWMISSVAFYI